MARIVVFGAGGKAGSRIVAEAAGRGTHEVTAVVRDPGKLAGLPSGVRVTAGDVTDVESVSVVAKGADAVVLAVGGPDPELYGRAVRTVSTALAALGPARPYIIHVGGGSSLTGADGVRFFDSPGFPERIKPNAAGQITALEAYLALPDDLPWTYLSPPPLHFAPGERRGTYRTGLDQPVTGPDGQARISYEDYAVAVVDEIEHPRHKGQRFTVGY